MSSRELPIVRANADFQLAQMVPVLAAGEARRGWFAIVCRAFRRRGISSLFLEGAPRMLLADLQRSGAAFVEFLKGAADADKITSQSPPFFDAVACEDWATAREIARYSRPTWNVAEEYEDDFLYVWFLLKAFFLDSYEAELSTLLAQYEAVLEGAADLRLDVCRALSRQDAAGFEAALDALLVRHRDRYQQARDEDRMTEEEWATDGQLSVEALALIRLAERRGLPVQNGYRFVPSLALARSAETSDPESWKNP